MPAPRQSPLSSPPRGDATHLELRFDGPVSPRALEDLAGREALLGRVNPSRVTTLDVALRGADLVPAVATSVARLVEGLPALQGLTLSLAGPLVPATTSVVADLCARCGPRGLTVIVNVGLDADADAFDALGRPPAATPPASLTSVLDASRGLRRRAVPVRWIVPVVPTLVHRLEALFSLARDEGVDPVLGPAAALDAEDRLFVTDFITYRLLEEEQHLQAPDRIDWYRALARTLACPDSPPPAPVRTAAVLSAAGADHGWRLGYEDRPDAGAFAGTPTARGGFAQALAGRLVAQAGGVGDVLLDGGRALSQWMRAAVAGRTRPRPPGEAGRRFARVLLIGAYGGEHIGDAAILGGVLFRINRRYGTTEAILMSQRPAHTRHLIPMLDTPFRIDVEAYEPATIRDRLPLVDAVVFAGGPLIDLPRQLVRHLYTVSLARRAGKPFIMEGIGPGPFPRRPSEWTARRLVRMAERIALRTATDAPPRLLTGLKPEPGRDPAFDYLETRGTELTRLRDQDRRWIERLLRDTSGRVLVGLNVRPIRHLFTAGVPATQRAAYTRFVEARFEERLAGGMRLFHQASPVPPCFVFFPMNAIQFGMSDLRSAYRLQRLLRADVDFRVWEADASLDGVVALLRRLDIVISMRFHATIFALAQQRRVIGIDYRVGARDKVAALLDDVGQGENCCRIDELTSDWLLQRLSALAGQGREAPAGRTLV